MSNSLKKLSADFFYRDIRGIKKDDLNTFRIELERFCDSGKKDDAFTVYYCFCDIFKIFGKATLGKLAKFLSDHEYHSGELLEKHRDHYSHSAYVFAIGLAIYAHNKAYRDALKKFYGKDFDDYQFLYHWGLIGLFHDVGYPMQLAHEQVRDYMKVFFGKDKEDNKHHNPHVGYLELNKLLKLSPLWKKYDGSRDLNMLFAKAINERLPYVKYDVLLDTLKKRGQSPVFMDHGYFSALLVSHQLMEVNIPLTKPLLDAICAILLHNSILRHYLAKDHPTELASHPLAYLIMLCDELQCWDRQAFGIVSKKAPVAWKCELNVDEKEIAVTYSFDTDTCYQNSVDKSGSLIVGYINQKGNNGEKLLSASSIVEDINKAIKLHLDIIPTLRLEHKEKKTTNFASSNRLLDLEYIAMSAHQAYNEKYSDKDNPELPNMFADIPDLFIKVDNIDQARSYAWKLELVNAFYSSEEMDYPLITSFEKEDLEYLAAQEHVRWVKNRIRYGWRYADVTDKPNHLHNSISPYGILSDLEKEKDLDPTKRMISIMDSLGIKIYSFREKWKPVIKVFGFGHRDIDMNDKKEVMRIENEVRDVLKKYMKTHRVIVKSCFAPGADLIIAKVALELGISLDASIPFPYHEYVKKIKEDSLNTGYKFGEEEENEWRNLIAQTIFYHEEPLGSKESFEASGLYNLNQADVVIAIWDGKEMPLHDESGNPINHGGTYHMLSVAESHLPPIPIHVIKCHRISK